MKNCLLLGGAGFMGRNLALYLLENNYNVTLYDRCIKGIYSADELKKMKYYEREFFADNDLESVIRGQDVVFHLISSVGPENSMENPSRCYANDVAKTAEILEIMKKNHVNKMIFISSGGTVYGESSCETLKEDMPLHPRNHYGIAKATIENMLQMYNDVYGMHNIVLRVSNPYGRGQRSNRGIGTVTIFAEKIINEEEIIVWGNGEIVRDYIYIDDVIYAFSKFIELNTYNGIFNVGTGIGTSLNELIVKLENKIGKKAIVRYVQGRRIDVLRNVLNMNKTTQAIGNIAKYTLDAGIDQYLKLWLR